jgi:nitrate/nitrite-specific signal transduction histidine kinase
LKKGKGIRTMTTERWTDEMVDDLASTVDDLASTVEQTTRNIEQTNRNVDMLVGAVNALLERDSQRDEEMRRRDLDFQQYKIENDQRFNTLLEEVRFLIRKLGENQG